MGRLDEDTVFGLPSKRPAVAIHEIGGSLERLSIDDIGERIHALQAEIGRLEAALDAKESSRRAADSFFKL